VFGSVEGEAGATLGRWQSEGDPRLWKLIVSPEFGERADLERLTRDLMARMEKDLGTRLEWVAVVHRNTEHPHVHIALRGVRDDGAPLDLPRDYVKRGVRAIAEDFCTRQLGHRTRADAVAAERREVQERRFTSLDRAIARQASQQSVDDSGRFTVHRPARPKPTERDQHIDARLLVLQTMGLAERSTPDQWVVRRDFETVLRAMQRTTDRQKTLAAHGALLSDQRLPLVVLDVRKLKSVEGRVLGHGEEDGGRHYMLLEGTDAKVHLIYYTPEMEQARSSGKLRSNSFVRLQKQFENGRPVLEFRDEGDSEKLLNNRRHFAERAGARTLRDQGDANWGGWLGRYLATLSEIQRDTRAKPSVRCER
jgi:type IV secretory pathway VirD2 relaxase